MYIKYTQTTKGHDLLTIKVVKKLAALILFLSCSFSAHAYRLKDTDVTVVNGVITQCTYDITTLGNIIEIPEVLDGQTITGLGDNCFSLAGKIKEVSLPLTLKTIGNNVFLDHNLTNVILPEGITSISYNAFANNSIETINLPNTLTSIQSNAFSGNKIKSIKIPTGISIIESSTFFGNKIEELIIPPNIVSIQGSAFGNNLIKSIFIPNTLSFLGDWAFYNNGLEKLTFEDGCKLSQILSYCFCQNKLTNVKLPNSIIVVDQHAFEYNTVLTSVSFNTSLKKIGKQAFTGCKLASVDLPYGLFYIGSGVFAGNPMTSFKLPIQTMGDQWTVGDGTMRNNGDVVTDLSLSYIVRIPYTLKDEDVEVYNGTIKNCSYTRNIENYGNAITIPETLDGQKIESIGQYSFSSAFIFEINLPSALKILSEFSFCWSDLNRINIPASVELLSEYCFGYNNIREISFEPGSNLKKIDNNAFRSNILTNVQIPGSVVRIGRFAFISNKLNNVTFEKPSSINTIESEAFNFNIPLVNLTLPEPEIQGYIYQGWLDGNGTIHQASQNNLTVNDYSTFYRVLLSYTLTDNDVVVENGVIISCSYDFTASNIVIPDMLDGQMITGIEDQVFYQRNITNVVLPSKLKFLGNNAFGSNIISEITIPATTDSIADWAFGYNYISNLIFKENSVIRFIGSYAFTGNRIDTLIIPNTINRIESSAFYNSQIEYLAFEDGSVLNFLGDDAFSYNSIKNNIAIPPLLKEIGKHAFQNNTIDYITLNKNVTDIGEGAFLGNPNVTITPLPTPETIPFVTWFIRWRDSDNNTLYPGYVITDFTKGYRALIDQYLNVKVQVNDDNGILVQGATIQFSDSLMVTNALGKDSIAPVIRGFHNYIVSSGGCLTKAASVDVQDDTFLQIILNRLYTFNIKVVDKNINPIKNVHIEIGDSILQSNTLGEANLMLIDGNYLCNASLPGYSIGSANFEIHDANASITIQLNPAVITYHPNGGIENSFSENATGSTYKIQNCSFTKKGYSFTRWNTNADGSDKSYAENINLTLEPGDLDLFAIWKIDTYQISYDLKGGQNDISNPASYTINNNIINLKPALPTVNTKPFFEGWFDSNGNKVESIPQGSTGDILLTASFIDEPSYVINYQNIMNGTHSNPGEYTRLDLPMTFQQASQNGYNFLGWYSENTFNNKIENLAAASKGDTTLFARWETIVYNLQYILNGGINATQNPVSYTFESSTISLQSAFKEGYTFGGWFADENFTQPITSISSGSTGNKTFYAKWILETYAIDYVLNGGINATQNPVSYTFESSTISLQSAFKEGYTFGGWFADENFTQPITSISSGSTGNKTFYAKWIILYLLSFEITTDGSTPAPGVSVIVDNSVTLVTDNNGQVQIYYEDGFQYSYIVELDNIEIKSGTGVVKSEDQLIKVEIVNVYMRWYDVIFCDNGHQLWTSFEWQKSGQNIGNEQFYHKEGGIENGQYSLIITSQSGKQYVWTKKYENNNFALSFYPNPVLKSQELTIAINGFNEFDDCELLIYNSSGQVVHKTIHVGTLNHLQLNSALREGIYLMVFTQKGKQLSSKQFIIR